MESKKHYRKKIKDVFEFSSLKSVMCQKIGSFCVLIRLVQDVFESDVFPGTSKNAWKSALFAKRVSAGWIYIFLSKIIPKGFLTCRFQNCWVLLNCVCFWIPKSTFVEYVLKSSLYHTRCNESMTWRVFKKYLISTSRIQHVFGNTNARMFCLNIKTRISRNSRKFIISPLKSVYLPLHCYYSVEYIHAFLYMHFNLPK